MNAETPRNDLDSSSEGRGWWKAYLVVLATLAIEVLFLTLLTRGFER